MITLSKLTASAAATPHAAVAGGVHNTQSQKGFWRRMRYAKNGVYFESSAGGSVFVATPDLWAMVEPHDANLCQPKPVAPAPAK